MDMKKKHFFFWATIVTICITLFSTCKKDKKDYRSQWIGSYDCEEIVGREVWLPDTIYYIEYVFSTTVMVTIKEESSFKFWESRGERSYEAKICKDGTFEEYDDHGRPVIDGYFVQDSLYMRICNLGALGGGGCANYKGNKL